MSNKPIIYPSVSTHWYLFLDLLLFALSKLLKMDFVFLCKKLLVYFFLIFALVAVVRRMHACVHVCFNGQFCVL